ncbi:MAG: type IV pilus biogenesis/stability protein PilW [Pseudomonadota bacterium]
MRRYTLLLSTIMLALLVGCTNSPVREDVEPQKAADANADLGLRYMQQGNHELALEKLKRALTFDPNHVATHHYMAELYRRLERPEDADKHFRKAIDSLDGEEQQASALYNNYGAFLCDRERYEEGEQQFRQVLENPVYPRPDLVYENMGLCLESKPDYEGAEAHLRKALERNPRLPKSLLGMARISLARENHLSARAYLQRYESIARHTPESLWLGIRIERVLGDKNALASYGLALKGRFPDAPETKRYLETQ